MFSQSGGDVNLVDEDIAVLAPAAVCCGQPKSRKLRSVTGLVETATSGACKREGVLVGRNNTATQAGYSPHGRQGSTDGQLTTRAEGIGGNWVHS